jgi:tRNA 2-selenouridine synthase
MRIQKRLGGLDTKNAVNFLLEGNIRACFDVLLKYYDKQYETSGERVGRKSVTIESPIVNPKQNAALILKEVINLNDNH